jgi:hypothetical protein
MIRPKRETKIAGNPRSIPRFLANSITLPDPIGPAYPIAYPFFTDNQLAPCGLLKISAGVTSSRQASRHEAMAALGQQPPVTIPV